MKKFLFCLSAACVLNAAAQETEKDITLDEVTVEGARTVRKVDGMWVYPTREQREHSSNGYSLLAKLALPHIRVDETMNTITALSNLGTVQVRINDVEATREDLQMLDMAGVEHVEYIDNPGVRYGEDVAYIINIKVRKPVGGYVVGTQLTNTLTTVNGNESLYGKVNRGRGGWHSATTSTTTTSRGWNTTSGRTTSWSRATSSRSTARAGAAETVTSATTSS